MPVILQNSHVPNIVHSCYRAGPSKFMADRGVGVLCQAPDNYYRINFVVSAWALRPSLAVCYQVVEEWARGNSHQEERRKRKTHVPSEGIMLRNCNTLLGSVKALALSPGYAVATGNSGPNYLDLVTFQTNLVAPSEPHGTNALWLPIFQTVFWGNLSIFRTNFGLCGSFFAIFQLLDTKSSQTWHTSTHPFSLLALKVRIMQSHVFITRVLCKHTPPPCPFLPVLGSGFCILSFLQVCNISWAQFPYCCARCGLETKDNDSLWWWQPWQS